MPTHSTKTVAPPTPSVKGYAFPGLENIRSHSPALHTNPNIPHKSSIKELKGVGMFSSRKGISRNEANPGAVRFPRLFQQWEE